MTTALVLHTCHISENVATDHVAPIPVHRVDKLGCGCTRYRGIRCDDSNIEWLDGACARHRDEA